MTQVAQNALRRSTPQQRPPAHLPKKNLTNLIPRFPSFPSRHKVIEKYTRNVRFCIICNYVNKIIPAIQSRCTRFRFAPLKEDQIRTRLEHVVEREEIDITEDGRKALLRLSGGDMRRTLNILQVRLWGFGCGVVVWCMAFVYG